MHQQFLYNLHIAFSMSCKGLREGGGEDKGTDGGELHRGFNGACTELARSPYAPTI